MLGNNAIARIFEHCGLMTDLGLRRKNSYKIEILTNPAYIEDEEIYAIKQKEKWKK